MQTSDSLVIDFIKAVPEDDQFNGGIKNFGKFSEGSCFEAKTVRPFDLFNAKTSGTAHPKTGQDEFWLLCLDEDSAKTQLMNLLIKLKIKKQKAAGIFASLTPTATAQGGQGGANTISSLLSPPLPNDPKATSIDGRWILLQDWTTCSQKCGGGRSFQHMMCIPPRKGGKPCEEGPAVRERPCQTQPCPQVQQMEDAMGGGDGQKIEKPIVKVMPISTRPQRYDKCYLKDTDALMEKTEGEGIDQLQTFPKVPIRLVMNNKSITVYQDETLHSNYYTFMLKDTMFARIKESDPNCFILVGKHEKVKFCSLGDPKFVEEWDYDFNLFKNQCKEKRETVELSDSEEDRLKKDYMKKMVKIYYLTPRAL
jgi:hypothetical protein